MKVKTMNKKNALLILGGSAMALTGKSMMPQTVHADSVKTSKVNKTKDTKKESQKEDQKQTVQGETDNYTVVTVKEGDTTWEIAQEYNKDHKDKTSVDQIVADNDLQDGGSLIHINDKLKVRPDDGTDKKADANRSNVETQVQGANTQAVNTQAANATQSTSSVSQAPQTSQAYQSQSYSNYQANTQAAITQRSNSQSYQSNVGGSEKAAKEWIAARESGGSYTARNPSSGTYGRYQLTPDKLHGDFSPANQERVADQYVKTRYGSWQNAKSFWMSHNWY